MRRRPEASWHKTAKPRDLTASVNEAVVQRKFMSLSGEICWPSDRSLNQSGPGLQMPGLPGLIPRGERTDEHR